MAGMVNHPPAARDTWDDTWNEESTRWLCDWRVLESLLAPLSLWLQDVTNSLWNGRAGELVLALLSAYFGPKMVSVIKQVVLLVGDTGGVMGKNLTSSVALGQPPIHWLSSAEAWAARNCPC